MREAARAAPGSVTRCADARRTCSFSGKLVATCTENLVCAPAQAAAGQGGGAGAGFLRRHRALQRLAAHHPGVVQSGDLPLLGRPHTTFDQSACTALPEAQSGGVCKMLTLLHSVCLLPSPPCAMPCHLDVQIYQTSMLLARKHGWIHVSPPQARSPAYPFSKASGMVKVLLRYIYS